MKKLSLALLVIVCFLVTGCGKNSESDILSDLDKKVVTFDGLKKDGRVALSEKVDDISEEGYIEGLGYRPELVKDIFASEIGKINFVKEDNFYFIFRKDSQVEAKEVTFEEVKSVVTNDYINRKAQEELKVLESQIIKPVESEIITDEAGK